MSQTDWRVWVGQKLANDVALIALIPAALHFPAGSLEGAPDTKPFMVIRFESEVPGQFEGICKNRATLFIHDEPGSYTGIDDVLKAAKVALVGADARVGQAVTEGGVAVQWQGNSGDLADPTYGTILRTASYDLHGKDN